MKTATAPEMGANARADTLTIIIIIHTITNDHNTTTTQYYNNTTDNNTKKLIVLLNIYVTMHVRQKSFGSPAPLRCGPGSVVPVGALARL